MRNLALESTVFGTITLFATVAAAQELAPLPEAAAGSNPAYQITATAADGVGPRLDIWQTSESGASRWIAVLNEHGEVTRTDDKTCPRFAAALATFRALPDLRPGPRALQTRRAVPQQIPSRRIHGTVWRIRLPAYAPDNSVVTMEIVGDQGPYAGWIGSTVGLIKACER